MGGSDELIEKLWAQFVLTAGPVNSEVTWTRDEVLVGSVDFQKHFVSFLIHIVVLLLVNHRNWNVAQIMSCVVNWAKAHLFYSLEFEERGVALWAFMRTWEKDTFCQVAVVVTDRFAVDATHELSVLESAVAAVGGSASLVAVYGGSHVLADT